MYEVRLTFVFAGVVPAEGPIEDERADELIEVVDTLRDDWLILLLSAAAADDEIEVFPVPTAATECLFPKFLKEDAVEEGKGLPVPAPALPGETASPS